MDINEFIEKFAEASDIEDYTSLLPTTEFRTLPEWSSLTYLSVIALLDEEFDAQIEMQQFKKLQTIEDIYNAVTCDK